MKINIEELVLKKWIVKKVNNYKMRMSCPNKGRGSSPKPIIFPRLVDVDKEFMEAIAMYIGDGKLSSDKYHLDFTSKDRDLVKFMLGFFTNRLNLKTSNIRYSLIYKKYNKKSTENWADYLTIPKSSINLKQSDRHREECFGMQIGGRLFRTLFGKIVSKILKTNFSIDTTLRRAFLRGLFAAEGGTAIVKKENYIAYIAYHLSYYKEKRLAELTQKLLRMEGITNKQILRKSKGERYLQITNWKNYHKCWKIGLFDLSQRKKKIFLDKINKTKFCCKISKKLKDKLLTMPNLSQRQLAFKIGVSPATICCLRKRNMFINVKNLIRLANLTNIPLYSIKQNVEEFAVNNRTIIKDSQFLDFVFKSQSEYIDYVPGNIKD